MNTWLGKLRIATVEGVSRLMALGQTLGAFLKGAFAGEDGGVDWKKILGQMILPLQMMEDFRPDWSGGIEAAGDKVAELDAEKDQADEQRRAKRERQEKQDQDRRRRAFEASEREAGEKAGGRAGAPRMAQDAAVRADDLRRIGANVMGSGRIGGQSKEELIAKATQATAQSAEQTAQILARMERDGGGAIF
jgi:pyruvate/2-oxoglutarate dehydrogenase complex dihydrolipoamide acyltransferase (E2) component